MQKRQLTADTGQINREKINISFDMFVLGQGIKTGVYRVCDELFPRLAGWPGINPFAVQHTDRYEKQSKAYLTKKGLAWPWYAPRDSRPSRDIDVLVSPFFAPWEPWANDCGILKVFIAYDLIALQSPQWFEEELALLVKRIYDNLDGKELIFSISQNTKRDLLTYRPDIAPERIIVLPLAAGEQFLPCADAGKRAAMRARYGIPPGIPYFLSLATLEIRKNLVQVLRAFSRLMEEQPDSPAYLVLAGMHGWKMDEFKTMLKGTGALRNRIILTGFVEDNDLSALYSDAHCFVYMSLYEGFGLPPLEAMACAIPVIASNTSSLPEVVGDAGIILSPHDTDGLCAAMRDELAIKGFERSKRFNWNRSAEIMMEAIQKELAGRPGPNAITLADADNDGMKARKLNTREAIITYAGYAPMLKKLRMYLPERFKRPLRAVWNYAKQMFERV
jgi:glycosyltransferase involved in cell wall biosynthesis